jgi:hypothetical protein
MGLAGIEEVTSPWTSGRGVLHPTSRARISYR